MKTMCSICKQTVGVFISTFGVYRVMIHLDDRKPFIHWGSKCCKGSCQVVSLKAYTQPLLFCQEGKE